MGAWMGPVIVGVLLAALVSGIPDGAVSSVNQILTADSGNVANVTVGPGIIYTQDINHTSSTRTWAGVFGNITGQIALRGTNQHSIKNWSIQEGASLFSDIVGSQYPLVLAYNDSTGIPKWTGLAGTPVNGTAFDASVGLDAERSDSGTNTLANASAVFMLGNKTVAAAASAAAFPFWFNNSVRQSGGAYQNVLLDDGTGNLLFASLARGFSASELAFDNLTQANYQAIVYAGNLGSDEAETYALYLELQ